MGILYRLVINHQKQESKKNETKPKKEAGKEDLRAHDVPDTPPAPTDER